MHIPGLRPRQRGRPVRPAAQAAISEKDLARSGGSGALANSTRSGFLPIGLESAPIRALRGIPVFVRSAPGEATETEANGTRPHPGFSLYCAPGVRFSETHRRRLLDNHVRFVYIRMVDHTRFRHQTERGLVDVAVVIVDAAAADQETHVEPSLAREH